MQVAMTGDVMLGRLVNSVLDNNGYAYVWGDTLDIIRNTDLSLINLECVVSSKGAKWTKTFKLFHFRANPGAIKVLKTASIDYVSLANNHTIDYGKEALQEMLELLDNSRIQHSGAGMNLKEAMDCAILKVGRKKVAVLSLTDNQPEWEASPTSPGINYIPLPLDSYYSDRLESSIQNARKNADIVVGSCHVGPHFREFPSTEYVIFAHRLMDLGLDIYWGHSNHMPQGIEIYKGKPILYDSGDFIDDYAIDEYYRNDLSFLFLIDIEATGPKSIELVPVRIHDFQASIALLSDAELVIKRMIQRCDRLGTRCETKEDNRIIVRI
jgi:poly-gamma-glutamate capsule biosynthesis protein CapA/YwtB (metallophosphatase superfamily)